ncbi:MAG: hypothetical protein WCJ51_01065 [Candidatus Moraniibacteriota bacterium]
MLATIKTKKTTKSTVKSIAASKTNQSDWKNLVQGFVENVFEHLGENVSRKVQAWVLRLKCRVVAFLLMSFGLLYLLIGCSIYVNSILGQIIPGLGYVAVGVLAILVGSLVGTFRK